MGSFTFPFALAHSAVAEMEELASRLRTVVSTHDAALDTAHVHFEGETRHQFDDDLAAQLDELQTIARLLDGDADDLRATIRWATWLQSITELNEQ